jgi:hypothetical protein
MPHRKGRIVVNILTIIGFMAYAALFTGLFITGGLRLRDQDVPGHIRKAYHALRDSLHERYDTPSDLAASAAGALQLHPGCCPQPNQINVTGAKGQTP